MTATKPTEILLPWWAPRIGTRELEFTADVLASGFLNDGPMTTRFEQELARLLGVAHVVAVTSGTAALFVALKSLNIGPGDEVVVPDVTFIATANAVRLAGATVVLADVDPHTLTLDPASFERVISRRTRAVIAVHISGRAGGFSEVLRMAQQHGLEVIEDAAQALGSRHAGRPLGTIGRLGCLSFSPAKIITTGQGGAVVTNDAALAQAVRRLKDQGRPMRGTGGDDVHDQLGYNFKFTDLQAAVGLAQLETLPARHAQMRRIYQGYEAGLAGVGQLALYPFDLRGGESPQWIDVRCARRTELVEALRSHGAECRNFWLPLHTQAPYWQPDDEFPVSTAASRASMWLPSALSMSDHDVSQVCTWIQDWQTAL